MILILDFGSQVTQLIARRFRELGFYSELAPWDLSIEQILLKNPKGIVLSGGHNSVYEPMAPSRDLGELEKIAPLLGICYGMQLMAYQGGGKVHSGAIREYGLQELNWLYESPIKENKQRVWMSHGDVVKEVPRGFEVWAESDHHIAAIKSKRSWGLQFHPEVSHTVNGSELLNQFALHCGLQANWNSEQMIQKIQNNLLKTVQIDDHILCGISGGVDSTVLGVLLTKIFGSERVHCVFVDNGLLRNNEKDSVAKTLIDMGLNLTVIDASKQFLNTLAGLSDPEQKRKVIGSVFIDIFEKARPQNTKIKWLAQGTLYPDVIESLSLHGGAMTIKSHHNVGGLPEKMNLKLLEPFRELFKDEVRLIGEQLGLSHEQVWRHPFPGPGLSIRILGSVTEEKLSLLRKADQIFIEYLKEKNLYLKIWQALCVLLPIQTVGVQGDGRTYENVLALRAVTSVDGMTADWYPFQVQDLQEISNRITNQVRGINRVVYDVTSKPPATIEWE